MMVNEVRLMDEVETLHLVLKLHLYSEFTKLASTNHASPWQKQLPPTFGRFTSRKVRRLAVSENANPEAMVDQVSEFFGATSNHIADRLEDLASHGILAFEGTGLRGVRVYRWTRPLNRGTLGAFYRLRTMFGEKLAFAFDLLRIHEAFGPGPFTLTEFMSVHTDLRRQRMTSRYGLMQQATLLRSSRYNLFLRSRLAGLFALGFLFEEQGRYRLTERGMEALLLFDLFARGVESPKYDDETS